jgi:GNAT superfamily N-acetyltransferase
MRDGADFFYAGQTMRTSYKISLESATMVERSNGVIRPAKADDVQVIGSLIRALAEYERLSSAAEFDEELLREHLFGSRPYAEVLLAEKAGEVVGFALFFHNYSTFLGKPGIYLEDLFVRPASRGNGYGKALFAAIARIAVERGCGRVEWSVLNWNEPSIAFYQSLGALPMDNWTRYRLAGEALAMLSSPKANDETTDE